jgi:antitoxin CptB
LTTTRNAVSDLGRLRWRCRRGMKELDVLLTRYVDERFAAAPQAEQQAFERLLDAQDPLIYAYCLGQAPVPPDLCSLVERITTACSDAARAGASGGQRC